MVSLADNKWNLVPNEIPFVVGQRYCRHTGIKKVEVAGACRRSMDPFVRKPQVAVATRSNPRLWQKMSVLIYQPGGSSQSALL